jgi:hypothetical protein
MSVRREATRRYSVSNYEIVLEHDTDHVKCMPLQTYVLVKSSWLTARNINSEPETATRYHKRRLGAKLWLLRVQGQSRHGPVSRMTVRTEEQRKDEIVLIKRNWLDVVDQHGFPQDLRTTRREMCKHRQRGQITNHIFHLQALWFQRQKFKFRKEEINEDCSDMQRADSFAF